MTQPPPIRLDAARRFLRMYLFDSDLAELEQIVRRGQLTPAIVEGVQALEHTLAAEAPEWTLLSLVEGDANWPLDDATDAGARAFLEDLVAKLRSWLGDKAPASGG
jgi:hypothetical protein